MQAGVPWDYVFIHCEVHIASSFGAEPKVDTYYFSRLGAWSRGLTLARIIVVAWKEERVENHCNRKCEFVQSCSISIY